MRRRGVGATLRQCFAEVHRGHAAELQQARAVPPAPTAQTSQPGSSHDVNSGRRDRLVIDVVIDVDEHRISQHIFLYRSS